MRLNLILIMLLAANISFAQNDDFPDYRGKREAFLKVQEKEIRTDLASFSMGGLDESIGKLPLKSIPVTEMKENSISFKGNGMEVNIQAGFFEPAKHKIFYYNNPDNNTKYVVRIDNKGFYGNYGQMPKTTIERVTVLINGDTVAIPQAAYADLFNPVFYTHKDGEAKTRNNVFMSNDGKRIYVYMIREDFNGGSYEVTWVIQDKKYFKRVVDFGF